MENIEGKHEYLYEIWEKHEGDYRFRELDTVAANSVAEALAKANVKINELWPVRQAKGKQFNFQIRNFKREL